MWFCIFFKHKTEYEMRISDWSSDVCSSDLGTENGNPVRKITMGKLSIITAAVIASCVAGCGDRAATTADTTTPPAAAETATPAPVDPDARRFDCQADTAVVVLDGTARVTLPGGELHALPKVADSDPEVYVGDALYFTLGADAAHLSPQEGMSQLASSAKASSTRKSAGRGKRGGEK